LVDRARKKIRRPSIVQLKTYKIKYLKKIIRLSAGASFGELALIMAKPRAATVKAVVKTDLATLNKEQFTSIVGKVEEAQINKKLDLLEMVPFFNDFSRAFKTKMTYYFQEQFLSRHQVLYKEDSESGFLYFIMKGEFEISKRINMEPMKKKSKVPLPSNHLLAKQKIVNLKICTVKCPEIVGLKETWRYLKMANTESSPIIDSRYTTVT